MRAVVVALGIVGLWGEMVGPAGAEESVLGLFRFEGTPGQTLAKPGGEPSLGTLAGWAARGVGDPVYQLDTPAAYLYDPISGVSLVNKSCLNFNGSQRVEMTFPNTQPPLSTLTSFTLELFFKPASENAGWIGGKTRNSDKAASFALQPLFLPQQRQTMCGAMLLDGDRRPLRWTTGHALSSSRIHERNLDWRHAALVFDTSRKTLTVYTNYFESASQKVSDGWKLDNAPLAIGGLAAGSPGQGFRGLIDEVRFTAAALGPAQFLRARSHADEKLRFTSVETVLPRGSGYIDLKEHFGAAGDGRTDDTEAFQRAFSELANKTPFAYYTLYIPPGEYLVSDSVGWSRHLFVQGAGPDKTIIRLKDHAAGFDNPREPRPIVRASSTDGPPGSNRTANGSSIGNYLFGVQIVAGAGNPGAKGLEYHANNQGCVEDVVIRSVDGDGPVGLDLTHKANGPALIKRVKVLGFDVGISLAWQEYSMTFEHITLEGQRVAGIQNSANILALRKVTSRNQVPAIISRSPASMVTLLDSDLTCGGEGRAAIVAEGALYARNVRTEGYKAAIEKTICEPNVKQGEPKRETRLVAGPLVTEYVGDEVVCLRGKATGSLKLPIEETPDVPLGDIHADWASIDAFADQVVEGDWTAAIQAAIDSGKRTIYFPHSCEVKGTVHLRGAVVRLFGGARNRLARPPTSPTTDPVMIFDQPDAARTVVIERLEIEGLVHSSPATLVVKHSDVTPYHSQALCGKLFLEDVGNDGWHFDHPQQIWARQWNPEAHGPGPCITAKGATLWALGFKTEYESSKLFAYGGAKVEILGAFIFPATRNIPADRPIFKVVNSELAVIYGTSVYVGNHETHILDADADGTQKVDNTHLRWYGSRARMDLYRSHPD